MLRPSRRRCKRPGRGIFPETNRAGAPCSGLRLRGQALRPGTGTVPPNSDRTPTAAWTRAAGSLPVHPVMNLSATTTRIAIGFSGLSSVVVSAVIGLPRGF